MARRCLHRLAAPLGGARTARWWSRLGSTPSGPARRLVLPWNGRNFAPIAETERAIAEVAPAEDDPG